MLIRIARRIVREIRALYVRALKLRYRFSTQAPGSADWLIKTEMKYGGFVTNVPRNRVSDKDPRSPAELKGWGMTGGDRMFDNGYAPIYAEYLRDFSNAKGITVAEFGILKGTGLAIWCDMFPEAKVIGLDIDPEHFNNNYATLVEYGAFSANKPLVCEFDQLSADGEILLGKIIGEGGRLDVVIDDGLHSIDAIINTFKAVKPFLAENFVYFVEDFPDLKSRSKDVFEQFALHEYGGMSVIAPRNVSRRLA